MLSNWTSFSSILLLLLAVNLQLVSSFTNSYSTTRTCRSLLHPLQSTATNEIASKLLETCAEYGQVGSKLTEEERSIIDNIASSLSPSSSPSPAKAELSGKHELIYSASPSASSGALGPLTGQVTQSFLDETRFINRVEFFAGAFKIELYAERKILDDTRIRVKFKETVISVFGQEVKRFEAKGSGIWDYLYSGSITTPSGEKMLLRVMKTPSTFVIVQRE